MSSTVVAGYDQSAPGQREAHRRHGQHEGMRIGPVVTTLLRHAYCPVAVVPHS